MAKQGWVSIHRSIQDHWLWEEKPFDKKSAWIDLILLANHKDNSFLLGNQLIEVPMGSLITSEMKLSERWGWGRKKVRNFLKLLEKDNMIVKKTDSKKTTLTIVKYTVYQNLEKEKGQRRNSEGTAREQQGASQGTAKEQRGNTNNNVNTVNNADNGNTVNKTKKKKTKNIEAVRPKKVYYENSELNDLFLDFLSQRKKAKAQNTDRAIKMLQNKISDFPDNVKMEIISESVMNNWKGLFTDKFQGKQRATSTNASDLTDNIFLKIGIEEGMYDE